MQHRPLRIVVLYSNGHLGSNIVLNQTLKMDCFEIVGIVKAKIVDCTPKGLEKAQKKFQKIGFRFSIMLCWQRIIQTTAFSLSKFLPVNDTLLKTSTSLTENIPTYECQSINDSNCQQFIKSVSPDLLVSAYFHQILKTETLAIPTKGTLNIHPGYLPSFKGSMNYFHAMLHKKQLAGASLHWMDEGIDTGEILARKSFKVKKGMTQESIMVKTAFIGSSLLKRIGNTLMNQKAPKALQIDQSEIHQYFKMPQRKHFLVYHRKFRFFRIRDIFGLIIWRPLRTHWKHSWK